MPTIADVAKYCGIAKSTVSLVINNSPTNVSRKTREKVLKAIREMNYQPSAHARSLSNQRANMIGIVTKRKAHVLTDSYYSTVIDSIAEFAADMDQTVALYIGRIWRDAEHTQIVFADGRCDGLLLLMAGHDQEMIDALRRRNIPFVTVNSGIRDQTINSVDIDNVAAGYQMTRYLLERGHRRIGCLHTGVDAFSFERLRGYRLALEESGERPDELLVFAGWYEGEVSAYVRGRQIAADRCLNMTALFAATDGLAIQVIQGLRDGGLLVPSDISVVGINDTADAQRCNPPLTTLSQSLETIGETAVRFLLDLIANGREEAIQITWPAKVIVRESVVDGPFINS